MEWTEDPHDFEKLQRDVPSGYVKIAVENGRRNSGFSPEKTVIFYSYVSHYQRVTISNEHG